MAAISSIQLSGLIKASGMISDFFNLTPTASERKLLFIDTSDEEKLFIFQIFVAVFEKLKCIVPFLKETHWTVVTCVFVFFFDFALLLLFYYRLYRC